MNSQNLEFIKVDPESPLNTEWVESFIKIGSAWETFTKTYNGSISGNLSAYGIHLESKIDFKFDSISFEVLKRLADVNAGNLMNDTYTYVTTIKFEKPITKSQKPFKIKSKNWLRLLFNPFNGFKKTKLLNGFIYYADSKEQLDKLIDLNISEYPNFGWIKRSNRDIIIRLYHAEDSFEGINNYIELLNKLRLT